MWYNVCSGKYPQNKGLSPKKQGGYMSKRLIAILVAVFMALTFFAGCKKDTQQKKKNRLTLLQLMKQKTQKTTRIQLMQQMIKLMQTKVKLYSE